MYWKRWWLNQRNRVEIGPNSWISRGVRFDFLSDGFYRDGLISIGRNCRLGIGTVLSPYGGKIELGENVFIGPYCVLYGHGGLKIGNGTMIAAHSVVVPTSHTFGAVGKHIREQPSQAVGITIAEDVWIGAGSCILDAVNIGCGSIVGAGSVVTRDVPPGVVVGGVPAKFLRSRSSETVLKEESHE